MSFIDTLQQMLVILFAVATGYLAHRLGYLNAQVDKKLSKLITHITIPALTLASVINTEGPTLEEIKSVFLVILLFYGLSLILSMVLSPVIGGTALQKGVWRFSLVISNAAFIGYPVIEGLLGSEGLFYAVIMVLPMTILNFTLAPIMVGGGQAQFSWRKILTSGTVCAVLALAITLTGYRPPALIGAMTDIVGDVTIPLSLLVLGSLLADMPAKSVLSSPRLWVMTAIRLLAMPAILALILGLLPINDTLMKVAVLQIGMPVALNGSAMCMEYGGDTETMARGVFLTTVLCILTIPVVAAVFL